MKPYTRGEMLRPVLDPDGWKAADTTWLVMLMKPRRKCKVNLNSEKV